MTEVCSKKPSETERFGEKLAKVLQGGEVIACFGGLGMGKTCFARGLARGMGLNAEVSSPTFALVHEYGGKLPLYHFDMYRITSFADLCSTGFFDYLDQNAVLYVEWSENIEAALPNEKLIRIDFLRGKTDGERILRINGEQRYEDSWR